MGEIEMVVIRSKDRSRNRRERAGASRPSNMKASALR